MSLELKPASPVAQSWLVGQGAPTLHGLRTFGQLTKFTISATATLTAATGYVTALHGCHWGLATVLAGTLLLAMGSSALNEAQECHFDAQMVRTRLRPIPSGRVSRIEGFLLGLVLAAAGFLILFIFHGPVPAFLGLLALLWYTAVYTPLKRVTAFAILPGALIGALPPAIGWASTGASLASFGLLSLCLFFFLWQIPHFWMLMMIYDQDYGRAGFPALSGRFRRAQSARLAFPWVVATTLSCTFLPLFGVVSSVPVLAMLTIASCWLVWKAKDLLFPDPPGGLFLRTFWFINLFALLVILAVLVDPLFSG